MELVLAYVKALPHGKFQVEVQKEVDKRVESFFHNFENEKELNKFKQENEDYEFITVKE